MSDHTKQFKCARCDCALKGPANPQPNDRIACPSCGEGDTLENVLREVGEHLKEQMAQSINKGFADAARGSKHFQFTPTFTPKGGHRFVVDVEPN